MYFSPAKQSVTLGFLIVITLVRLTGAAEVCEPPIGIAQCRIRLSDCAQCFGNLQPASDREIDANGVDAERNCILEFTEHEKRKCERVLGVSLHALCPDAPEYRNRFGMCVDSFVDSTDASQKGSLGTQHFCALSRRHIRMRRGRQCPINGSERALHVSKIPQNLCDQRLSLGLIHTKVCDLCQIFGALRCGQCACQVPDVHFETCGAHQRDRRPASFPRVAR